MSVLDPTQADGRPAVPLVDIDEIKPDESLLSDLRKTRITTPATRALLVLIVLSVGFLGGALVDRHERPASSAATNLSTLISRFGGRGGRGAAGGSGGSGAAGAAGGAAAFFGGAGGGTVGTVKLVDGNDVYIQDTAGDDIEVTTNPSTQITVSQPGKVSQLLPGATISVAGKTSSDGTSIAATSITPSVARGLGAFAGGAAATTGTGSGG